MRKFCCARAIGESIVRAVRHFVCSILAPVALLALSGAATNAAVLYQNPDPITSTPGNVDAWSIYASFIVADTFTLSSNSNLSSIDFLTWNSNFNHVFLIDWSITSGPDSGTILGSGTASVTDVLQLADNGLGFNLDLNTFDLNLNLAAGTYWLNLQNAHVVGGNPVYWDQGGGGSQAWDSAFGFLSVANGNCGAGTNGSCAETFDINGTENARIPEPITLSLFGVGLAGALAMRRRKSRKF